MVGDLVEIERKVLPKVATASLTTAAPQNISPASANGKVSATEPAASSATGPADSVGDPEDAVSRFLRRKSTSSDNFGRATFRERFGGAGRRPSVLALKTAASRPDSPVTDDGPSQKSWMGTIGRRRSASASGGTLRKAVCCLAYSSRGLSRCAECGKAW
mmetsp:Transcript_18473/g.48211  ORF Transcript_18473/g.48211 Transcript_18473/m.48211 type:complete len:160 (+) Transcript_18473:247-726(+)